MVALSHGYIIQEHTPSAQGSYGLVRLSKNPAEFARGCTVLFFTQVPPDLPVLLEPNWNNERSTGNYGIISPGGGRPSEEVGGCLQ